MSLDAESTTYDVNSTITVDKSTSGSTIHISTTMVNNNTKNENNNKILLVSAISSAGTVALAAPFTITVLIMIKICFVISSKLHKCVIITVKE